MIWLLAGLCLAFVLAACGPLGNDDDTPATETPVDAPQVEFPTPEADPATPPEATPIPSPVEIATPVVVEDATPPPDPGTPLAPVITPSPPAPPPTVPPTPTPVPPVAANCAPPAPLPEVVGSESRVTIAGLNLRAGPGTACDELFIIPEESVVTALSGPVLADDLLWIRVDYEGQAGWVAEDFLEPAGSAVSGEVAVLLYHYLDRPGTEWSVTSEQLNEQMAWLRGNGYQSVTTSQLVDALRGEFELPRKAVVITIDDGSAETMTFAQILGEYDFLGTYYLPNNMVLEPDDVRALREAGAEICGHTVTHLSLPELEVEEQQAEIVDNKQFLEELLGEPIRCFAYPFGAFDDDTVRLVAEAGYDSAVDMGSTPVRINEAVDFFHIARVQALGTLTMAEFTANFPEGRPDAPPTDGDSEDRGEVAVGP